MGDIQGCNDALERLLATPEQRLDTATGRLSGALSLAVSRKRGDFERRAGRMSPQALLSLIATRSQALSRRGDAVEARLTRKLDQQRARFDNWSSRLAPSLSRLLGSAARDIDKDRKRLSDASQRLEGLASQRLADLSARLDTLDRMRQTMGHAETLRRGYAVVRGDGVVVTSRAAAEKATALEIEFHDGKLPAIGGKAAAPKKSSPKPPTQGSLF